MLVSNGQVQLALAVAKGQALIFRFVIIIGIVAQVVHINKTKNGQLAVVLLMLPEMRDKSACFKQLAQLCIGIQVHEQQ